jgi:hypothetical protein
MTLLARAPAHRLEHYGQPRSAVVYQVDAIAHAGVGLAVGPAGQGLGHHAARARRTEGAVAGSQQEVADPDDLHVAHEPDPGDAVHLVAAAPGVARQPGVQAYLDVDVLVGGPGGRHGGQVGRVRA